MISSFCILANLEVPAKQGMQQGSLATLACIGDCVKRLSIATITRYEVKLESVPAPLTQKVNGYWIKRWTGGYFRQLFQAFWLALFDADLKREIRLREKGADVVYVEGVVLFPILFLIPKKKALWSMVDSYSLRYRRRSEIASSIKARLALRAGSVIIRLIETIGAARASWVHVFSEEDADYLGRIGIRNVCAIPIPRKSYVYLSEQYRETDNSIVFTGSIDQDYVASSLLWFFDNVFLHLSEKTTLKILHGVSSKELLPDRILKHKRVKFTGWVSDYYDELRGAALCVMPDLCGTGIKNRLIDSANAEVPFVATDIAAEGTKFKDGISYYRANTALEFRTKVKMLLDDRILRQRIGRNAKQVISEYYDHEVVKKNWEQLLKKVVKGS